MKHSNSNDISHTKTVKNIITKHTVAYRRIDTLQSPLISFVNRALLLFNIEVRIREIVQ
jgi:hypothetical protein